MSAPQMTFADLCRMVDTGRAQYMAADAPVYLFKGDGRTPPLPLSRGFAASFRSRGVVLFVPQEAEAALGEQPAERVAP